MSILKKMLRLLRRVGKMITYPLWIKNYNAWKQTATENPVYNIDCKHLVFIYGDAKRSFYREYLLCKATFIEPTITAYPYFDLLTVNNTYPGMIYQDLNKKEGYQIAGELYEVNGRTLWELDHSNRDSNLYKRETIFVNVKNEDNNFTSCFVYLTPRNSKDLRLDDDKRNTTLIGTIKRWEYPLGFETLWYFAHY